MNNKSFRQRILVTGGAGFIGSNLLLKLVPEVQDSLFINIDALTYAGNLTNLRSIEQSDNYRFEKIDICDIKALSDCFERYQPTGLIHLAAESHVDRSILGPSAFIQTNIIGTFNLLEIVRRLPEDRQFRFHHVSTDEVFGSLGESGAFSEITPYRPNSPYSASKASGDHLVRAYHKTYGLNIVTTNCSNNYGPYQFPEKLIPLMINNAKAGKPLPVYGDGLQIRDWLFVGDHCDAMYEVFCRGESGQTYNIGGNNEIENIELVRILCALLDKRLGGGPREELITFVEDRPGHDRRYAIDASKIKNELGWEPKVDFEKGMNLTIDWYLNNEQWLTSCISGEYQTYYETMYSNREVR